MAPQRQTEAAAAPRPMDPEVDRRRGHQGEDGRLEVVQDRWGGATYRICSRGVCLQDRDGARLMARYADLLRSQGLPVP